MSFFCNLDESATNPPPPPPQQQGIRVLGCRQGFKEYVQSQLEQKSMELNSIFHIIPQVLDTQASWL